MILGSDCIGVGVGAIVTSDRGKILLIKRGSDSRNEIGCWENPGGVVEWGETFEKAIIREVKEELDIRVRIIYKLPVQECFLKSDNQHWITQTFVTSICEGEVPHIVEVKKHTQIKWFEVDRLPSPLSLISKEDIRRYLSNQD